MKKIQNLFLFSILSSFLIILLVSDINIQLSAQDNSGKIENREIENDNNKIQHQAIEPQEKKEADKSRQRESVWKLIMKGGWTMLGLGLITTLIIAFSLERAFFFKRQKIETKNYYRLIESALQSGGLSALEKEIKSDKRLISRILHPALLLKEKGAAQVEKTIEANASVEIGKLEKGLNLLSNLGNIAPLLGFLGTVIGMRTSFLQFVDQAAPTAKDLAGGIEEALITTAAGLLIAIPTYLIYNIFIYYIDSLTIEIERCASTILSKFH